VEAAKPENGCLRKLSSGKIGSLVPSIPGRDGLTLKYICRNKDKDEAHETPNDDFLDDYVAMAPLAGDSFAIDTVQGGPYVLGRHHFGKRYC
jgi:hypothetical protein